MTGRGRAAAGRTWEVVLFDLDGTLADTVPLILHCYRHTMTAHRGAPLPDELWLRGLGRPLRDQLGELARDAEEAGAMLETYVTFQRTVHDEMVRPFPRAADVLEGLKARGTQVGVVTSKREEMALRTLDRCGLLKGMDVVVTADDVDRGKPDPEPVRLALERLGRPRADGGALFIGDSPWDLQAGRAAGVRTGAALWGPFERSALEAERPDFVVRKLIQVLEL